MALKPDRRVDYDTIAYFMNATAERGVIVIHDTSVSGLGGLDDANALVALPSTSGGVPVGMLMNDMVNVDLTRYRLNEHQDEVQQNSKVTLLKRGMVKTNKIVAGLNPVQGSGAYFTTSGELTMFTDALVNPRTVINGTGVATPSTVAGARVGTFDSSKDADGYVRVEINLP